MSILLVSAYYKIPSKWPSEKYEKWIANFMKIKTPKVIFTNELSKAILSQYDIHNNTNYVMLDINSFYTSINISDEIWNDHFQMDPEKEHHTVPLYKIWNEKIHFVKLAIDTYKDDFSHYIWCDVGCFRDEIRTNQFLDWPQFMTDKVTFLQIEPFTKLEKITASADVSDIFLLQKSRIGGGIFGGSISYLMQFHDVFYRMLLTFIKKRIFAGKDQSIYAHCILQQPQLFNVVQVPNSYRLDPWFYLEDYFNDVRMMKTQSTQKPTPLISILIPLYNGVEYLREALESVFDQTYTNYEILIGINGYQIDTSVDVKVDLSKSASLAQNQQDVTIPQAVTVLLNMLIFSQLKKLTSVGNLTQQQGQRIVKQLIEKIQIHQFDVKCKCTTMNILTSLTSDQSDWICILDVDDKWASTKLERQVEIISASNLYSVIGTQCQYFGSRSDSPTIPLGEVTSMQPNPIINSSAMIKKSIAWWDPEWNAIDDYELWLRLNAAGYKFYNIPGCLVYHRVHNDSHFNGSTRQQDAIEKLKIKYNLC